MLSQGITIVLPVWTVYKVSGVPAAFGATSLVISLNVFAINLSYQPSAIAKAVASSTVAKPVAPVASLKTIFSAGRVQNIVLVPDDQLTALSELLDCNIVVTSKGRSR